MDVMDYIIFSPLMQRNQQHEFPLIEMKFSQMKTDTLYLDFWSTKTYTVS